MRSQSGNVLFLILITVALFAALSYVVTRSSLGGKNPSAERLQLAANELQNYFVSIDTAFLRMRMSGLSAEQINWENPVWQSPAGSPLIPPALGFAGPTSCTHDRCQIFSPHGGGMYPKILEADLVSSMPHAGLKNGHAYVTRTDTTTNFSVQNLGTSLTEYALVYQRISLDFCLAYNKANKVENRADNCPPTATTSWWSSDLAASATQLIGQRSFCVFMPVPSMINCRDPAYAGQFFVIHVVFER